MTGLVRPFQGLVRTHSGAIVIAFAVAAIAAGLAATRVEIDTSVERLMISGDPERELSRALKQEFSNDEVLVVAYDLGGPFSADDLRKLSAISLQISALEGVEEVLDLSTIEDVRGSHDTLDASALLDLDSLDTGIDALRRRVAGHRLYERNLVSDELDVLATIVVLEASVSTNELNHVMTEELITLVAERAPPWRAHISGYPANEYHADRLVKRDLVRLSPIVYLVILVVMYVATRSWPALGLLSALVGWSVLVTLAWFALTATPLTMVTSAVPAIMLATAATYAIYFIGLLQAVSDLPQPGVAVVRLVLRPALLSAMSTSIGFLSLRVIEVQVLQDLGTGLAVGIAAAAIGTLLLLPALVHRYNVRLPSVRLAWMLRWTTLGVRMARRPVWTAVVWAFAMTCALPGLSMIRIESDPMDFFRSDSEHRRSDRFVRDRLAGTGVVNVVVRSESPGSALEPEVLRFSDDLVRDLERSEIVDRTISFLDYLFLMDTVLNPDKVASSIPPSRAAAAQYLLLYEAGGDPGDYRHYINHERSALNILVRTNRVASSAILSLRDRIRSLSRSSRDVEVSVLGSLYLLAKSMDRIARGMLMGLGLAVILIGVVMTLALRSLRLALVAAVPNILPILVCGGLMGWLGVPLSVGTSVVGCIALGLAVDDTAHVLGHVGPGQSLVSTYRLVGRPIALTSACLGAGFSALLLSEFQPVATLGAATAVTLAVALLADVLPLPSLLVLAGFGKAETADADVA